MRTKKSKASKRVNLQSLPILHPDAAGIDVGANGWRNGSSSIASDSAKSSSSASASEASPSSGGSSSADKLVISSSVSDFHSAASISSISFQPIALAIKRSRSGESLYFSINSPNFIARRSEARRKSSHSNSSLGAPW